MPTRLQPGEPAAAAAAPVMPAPAQNEAIFAPAQTTGSTQPLTSARALHRQLLKLQRTVGNRGTVRAVRSLHREPATSGYDFPSDPQTVNSPFPLRVLIGWLHQNPVTELDPERYERAYDRNQVEPDPLGCMWKGQVTTCRAVADAFMAASGGAGYSFRRDDVLSTIRDQVAQRKRAHVADIAFMPRGAWDRPTANPHDSWFPWAEYGDSADQFGIDAPDPFRGPAGPIVDWLEWYSFDAPWPASDDPDRCIIHAQGEATGRVLGVVRLYMNDAIRAGYLGVDRDKVAKHIREDLEERKPAKRQHPDQRIMRIDDRGHDRRQTTGPTAAITALPAPPHMVKADGVDDWQQTIGPQWTWTAGKAKPDRTVNITLQKGTVVLQGSVNLDTRAYTWVGGLQPQVSTPEYHFLGGLISGQLFVQIMAGLTMSSPASGTFTVQAAVGAQLTLKWGPITMQVQAGPQAAWDPVNGWQGQFAASPAAGPTDATSAATFGPGASSPLPAPVTIGIKGTF
ncbi:MAG: hypothetical protein ACJ780_16055 [Solirubrobacteraceae bacterium]